MKECSTSSCLVWLVAIALAGCATDIDAPPTAETATQTQAVTAMTWQYATALPSMSAGYHYDYEPTAIWDNGKLRVWWCGAGGRGGDSIWYAESTTGTASGFTSPSLQISSNGNYPAGQVNIACAPSVVKYVDGSYRMYFECQQGTDAHANVCTARSWDGYNWDVWTGDATGWVPQWYGVAKPILYANPGTGNYGTGHPSAIVNGNDIWLYVYVDGQGYLFQSWDGIHPFWSHTTSLTHADKVYQVSTPNGTEWLATIGNGYSDQGNYYVLSDEGLNFYTQPEPLSYATTSCVVSEAAIASGNDGHISFGHGQNPLALISAEGYVAQDNPDGTHNDPIAQYMDPKCRIASITAPRGYTWDNYYVQGWFYLP